MLGLKLLLFRETLHLKIPPVLGSPHSGLYPGLCKYLSIHVPAGTSVAATGTAVAVDPAGTVAVGPVGTDVAVGAGDVDVACVVGVAESPAHASATVNMSTTRIAIIGFVLYVFRNITYHLP
jgi:hypothetical protein